MEKFFKLKEYGMIIWIEIIVGLMIFFVMLYILFVNLVILF